MFEERPRKVHLYRDQKGRKQRRGLGKPVDNTLCASNHGDRGLLTTDDPKKVTCKRCLKLLEEQNPVAELTVMLTESSKHLSQAEDLLDLYRRRCERLERTLGFALDQLGDDRHVVIHVPTMMSVGELIDAVLADKVKEPKE